MKMRNMKKKILKKKKKKIIIIIPVMQYDICFQMSRDAKPPDDCKAFVDVHGEKTCDPEQVNALVSGVGDR